MRRRLLAIRVRPFEMLLVSIVLVVVAGLQACGGDPSTHSGSKNGGSLCGNGILDAGEDCDSTATPPADECPDAGNGLETCRSDCSCACPQIIDFAPQASDPASRLDSGWTGIAHGTATAPGEKITVAVTGCENPTRSPNCGVCTFTGPIGNVSQGAGDLDNQRCSNNTSVRCTDDERCFAQCVGGDNDGSACTEVPDCAAPGVCLPAGRCLFYFESPLPISTGGVPVCVINEPDGTLSGTANIETGEATAFLRLTSRVFIGPVVDRPCPTCVGDQRLNDTERDGACAGGGRDGLACDGNGSSPIATFGTTSLDCPPLSGANIGNLSVTFAASTTTVTRTLSATSPPCRAVGFTTRKCLCSTCQTAAAESCMSDADCPAGRTCGGLRCLGGSTAGEPCSDSQQCAGGHCGVPGLPTAPNQCADSICTATSSSEGECAAGPVDSVCSPSETFRGCASAADCQFPGDVCVVRIRKCFSDNGLIGGSIVAEGVADTPVNLRATPTLATVFCLGPVSAPAVNSVAGLPGPARLTLRGLARALP